MLPIEVQGMIDSFLCQKTMTQIEASGVLRVLCWIPGQKNKSEIQLVKIQLHQRRFKIFQLV